MDIKKRLTRPFAFALVIHLTLLALFALSALYKPAPIEQPPVTEIIHATMIDLATLPTEVEKDNPETNAKQENTEAEAKALAKAEAEAAKQAKAEAASLAKAEAETAKQEKAAEAAQAKAETAKQEKAAAAQAKAEAAKQEKAAEAAQAKAEAAKQEKAAEAAQAKAETAKQEKAAEAQAKAEAAKQEKAEADAAEARKNKLAAQASESTQAKLAIQKKVERSWIRPPTVNEDLKCTIKVKLMSDGTVISAEVISSSGDEIFDRSAENAVQKASPLPVPNDKELFAQEFRSFQFSFNPK